MPDTSLKEMAFAKLYSTLSPPKEGRVLYISRHGESLYNLENRIGGNPGLSPRGLRYAKALGSYMNSIALPDLKVGQVLSLHVPSLSGRTILNGTT